MCRNKANAGEGSLSVEEVTRRAVLFANCSYQLENNTTCPANQGRRAKSRWMPPPPDVLEINTDAAFREAEKDGAWGYVIRDCNGLCKSVCARMLKLLFTMGAGYIYISRLTADPRV